jgi:hypothetical protein
VAEIDPGRDKLIAKIYVYQEVPSAEAVLLAVEYANEGPRVRVNIALRRPVTRFAICSLRLLARAARERNSAIVRGDRLPRTICCFGPLIGPP